MEDCWRQHRMSSVQSPVQSSSKKKKPENTQEQRDEEEREIWAQRKVRSPNLLLFYFQISILILLYILSYHTILLL
jgi:hypothetical protein